MSVINGLWQPRSDCGPDCLPSQGETPAVSGTRQAGRLAALLGALLLGVALLPVLPLLPAPGRWLAGRTWARTVLRALGIGLAVRGRLPRRRVLLVSNHVSWLDIITVLAVSPARLVAKHDVRRWPLIGALAAAGGTIFVDRTRPRDLPKTVARLTAVLRAGGMVAVFPEGTTWCGVPQCPTGCGCGSTGRFRPAMFQAAIDAGAMVVPLTLRYQTGRASDATTTAAAFLGDDSLWASVRRVLAVRGLIVSATVASALHPASTANRRRLAQAAESVVRLAPAGGVRVAQERPASATRPAGSLAGPTRSLAGPAEPLAEPARSLVPLGSGIEAPGSPARGVAPGEELDLAA